MSGPAHRVANPPSKTLMVYDGDCGFCKLWIARWRETTAGAVDYEPLQEAAARFPEVPRAEFERAVKLIRDRRAGFQRSGSGLSFVRQRRRHKFLALVFRACPGLCADFGTRLRTSSPGTASWRTP